MNRDREPLKVFFTIDTELWPLNAGWQQTALEEEAAYYVYGQTPVGSFGLPYQLDVFGTHNLKAVFFVESLFATVMAEERLGEIVWLIKERSQDVQLHIHTEWLQLLQAARVSYMKDYSESDQTAIIQVAAQALRKAGSGTIQAFRAGNYGANNDTLTALNRAGIPFDTSYNPAFLSSQCGIRTKGILFQPACFAGTWEIPVSSFFDLGSHLRPAQLCACSVDEMRHALNSAWQAGWRYFEIVSHSFELLQKARGGKPAQPNKLIVSRFESLCAWLESNRDRFLTVDFRDLSETSLISAGAPPLRSHPLRTAVRMVEQVVGRRL
jgi:hypothetical protein